MAKEHSNVVPILSAALACDTAAVDPANNKKSLIGIFDRIYAQTFPVVRPLTLYLKVADAQGKYKVEMRLVHLETHQIVGKVEAEAEFKDRLQSTDHYFQFPKMAFPIPGRYELQIWANDAYLGGTVITVAEMPKATPEGDK